MKEGRGNRNGRRNIQEKEEEMKSVQNWEGKDKIDKEKQEMERGKWRKGKGILIELEHTIPTVREASKINYNKST